MDDNLDTLGPQTIHWPKKSSEKKANQQENEPYQKQLYSQGEDVLNNLQCRNQEIKTHWPRSGVNTNLHLQALARLPNWQQTLEGGQRDYFSAYHIDQHDY